MVGRPVTRAKRLAKEAEAAARRRDTAFAAADLPIPRETPFKPPRRPRSPPIAPVEPPPGAIPPMSDADAAMMASARSLALRLCKDFLEAEVDERDPDKLKLKMKKLEIAQSIISVSGRIDPGGLRGAASDEFGEMLARIRSRSIDG